MPDRGQQLAAGLPLAAVATWARISAASLRSLEAGSGVRLTPRRLARVLRAVDIHPAEAAEVVGCELWGLQVLARLRSEGRAAKPERWLRPEEVARLLKVSTSGLAAQKRMGLPYHRLPGSMLCLYRESDIAAWKDSRAWLPREPPPRHRTPRYQPRRRPAT